MLSVQYRWTRAIVSINNDCNGHILLRLHLLCVFLPELLGFEDKYSNSYAKPGSLHRLCFQASEAWLALEIIYDLNNSKFTTLPELIGCFKLKHYSTIWSLWLCFGLIPFYMSVSIFLTFLSCFWSYWASFSSFCAKLAWLCCRLGRCSQHEKSCPLRPPQLQWLEWWQAQLPLGHLWAFMDLVRRYHSPNRIPIKLHPYRLEHPCGPSFISDEDLDWRWFFNRYLPALLHSQRYLYSILP